MEKSLLKYLYPPKETQSAHLGPSMEAAVRLHSLIIPHPPTRKGIFINSTKIQCVENTLSPCSQISHKNRAKEGGNLPAFLCFLFGKASFSLIPGLSREKRSQVTQKCPWGRRRRALKSWHFIFGVFFLFFIHCFLRAREEKLWPSWFVPQLLDMKIIFFFPLNFLQKHLRKFSGKICSFPLRNLAVLWVGCENKDEFPFTLRRFILEFLSTFYEGILYKLHKQVQKGPIFLYLQWSLF